MSFRSGRVRDFYLLTTEVENIFINEYMPQAPGDYVKVYLYALLYSKQEMGLTHQAIARQLKLTESEIDRAWKYWEDMGVVKRERTGSDSLEYDVIFVNLRELMYANNAGANEAQQALPQNGERLSAAESLADRPSEELCEEENKALFDYVEDLKGMTLSAKELREIASWRSDLSASADVIKAAFQHCYEKGKTQLRYVEAVVREWTERGIKTGDEARELAEQSSKRFGEYKRILSSLGIVGRVATDAERDLIDKWFDEMGFSLERILEACGKTIGIQNPNVNYVNKILENWQKDAATYGRSVNQKTTVNQAALKEYYEYLRHEAEKKSHDAKAEIYEKLPRIEEIDGELVELGSRLSRALLGGSSENVDQIRKLMMLHEEERAVLLTENNYPLDYTDIKYLCQECKDTGIDESGRRCKCSKERIGEAEIWLNAKKNAKNKNEKK